MVEGTTQTAAPAERLPSGRHRLAREDVIASQRARMLAAIAGAVSEKGYAATTVADVVDRAGVSRRTFYEQFPGKEECFVAAYDYGVEVVLGRMAEAAQAREVGDWRARLRSDLETYLQVLADEPEFAWALHVEVLGAGQAALERRATVFELFSERTRLAHENARAADPELPELPPEIFRLHTGGMDELIRECLRTRGADALPELAGPTVEMTFALFGETRAGQSGQ
jgi:AcrR family transcriptional regulator